jgi:hypothetical protein
LQAKLGKTTPSSSSFTIVLEMQKEEEWKPLRKALNKSKIKMFERC